jgi:5-methylcytosine-specific restriction protein B
MLNRNDVLNIISKYKKKFEIIHENEIYKWKAVKCFQDYWEIDDIGIGQFPDMLERALEKAGNLLTSQNVFPKEMIRALAE